MRARVLGAAIALPLLLATAVPVLGQSVLLRLNPEPGLVSRYVMGMETRMDNPMMSSDQPFMVGEIYSTQKVLGVEGDVVEYETVTDSANLTTPAMPMLAGQLPNMAGQTQRMKMDTRGHVVEMDMTGVPEEARGFASQMGGMGLQLPEGQVSPGDSWNARIDSNAPGMPGGGEMSMVMEMTFTLVKVAESAGTRLATISFQGPIVLSGSSQGAGIEANGTTSGTIVFDVNRGRIHSNEMKMSMDMNAAGMAMSMNQNITMRLAN